MRKRVDALVPGKGRSVWISTFHSFCAQLLRVEAKNIKLDPAVPYIRLLRPEKRAQDLRKRAEPR